MQNVCHLCDGGKWEAQLQNTQCGEKSAVREERRLVSVAIFASARKELYLGKKSASDYAADSE